MDVSFKRRRLPIDVIRHVVWPYFRFTLSLRNVEEMLAERGGEVSYNAFYTARHLTCRPTLEVLRAEAFEVWSQATCAWISAELGIWRPCGLNLTALGRDLA